MMLMQRRRWEEKKKKKTLRLRRRRRRSPPSPGDEDRAPSALSSLSRAPEPVCSAWVLSIHPSELQRR